MPDTKKRKKRKVTQKQSVSEQSNNESFLGEENIQKRQTKSVDVLSYKKLSVGMKVLGAVKEVDQLDFSLCLANGLSGFVHITRINEKITSVIKGQLQTADDEDDEQVRDFQCST